MKLKIFITILVLSLVMPHRGFSLEREEEKFQVAVKAFSDGFYDASLSLFKKFVEVFPNSALLYEAKLYIAKCYYYKEDYPQALKVLGEIEKEWQMHNVLDEVYYWLAVIYFKGKDFNQSFAYAKRIIENFPESQFKWWAYYLMATNNLELGKKIEAEKVFLTIINEGKETEVIDNSYSQLLNFYFQNKRYAEVVSLGNKYVKDFPKGDLIAKVYFYLGESHYVQSEWNEALENYKSALAVNKDENLEDLIRQGLGFSQLAKGRKADAKVNIDKIKDKELRLFSQGVYYFKTNDYIQALDTFTIFIRDYPQSELIADAYLNKADILYELGRLNDSIYFYTYVIDNFKEPRYRDFVNKAHYGLAWSYLKSGKFKRAIDEFKDTLEYADNPVVKVTSQIQIADAYQETDKYLEALEIYNNILKDYPNTVYADYIQFQIGMIFLKQKDLERAFLALKNLKNNFPSSKLIPQAQYYLAGGYFSLGDYAEAKSLLEDFIQKFPQNELIAKVYYLYGKCFFNEKDYEQSLLIFKKIIGKFRDKDIEELVYIDMGNAYLNLSAFENAKKVWKDFLKKYPSSQYASSVALYLGGLYEKEKDYIQAQEYYKKIIRNDRSSSWAQEALLSLGHLCWQRGDLEEAEKYFRQLSNQATPLGLKGKLYLAKVFIQKGENIEAFKLYDSLINSESSISKIALVEKAFLFKEMKNYQQAITSFKKAIEANIDTPEVRFSLGLCLEKVGRDEEAVEEYFKSIYAFSNQEDQTQISDSKNYQIKSYFRIARIYEKRNNIEEAKKIYKKIIDLNVEESKIAEVRLGELSGEHK